MIAFFLDKKLMVLLLISFLIVAGILTAPFDWTISDLPNFPVPVDAIPNIGENQQIVFTEWKGRSPQDIEDQISYPLSAVLLGIPGVKSIRSSSMFGFSSIYVIFEDHVDFYWSRSRILEKLSSLPANTLPEGVRPTLGPDATALGQVFWYTLEGYGEKGRATGGWDLHELRSIQDWQVRYELMSVPGVAEVASVGGFVQEYQVEVNPQALRLYGIDLGTVARALRRSNSDVGARTIEMNRVEYVIRGLGLVDEIEDLQEAVVRVENNSPIRIADLAKVSLGPALRRGALDKGGSEAVGGVVTVRYGANPLEVIQGIKKKIESFSSSLPSREIERVKADGSVEKLVSQVKIVPFYDRSEVIYETLGTLGNALYNQILITIIVIVLIMMNIRTSVLVSGLLPLAVLIVFILMKLFAVDANVVALSGIAIAIGTMVDMGIVLSENISKKLEEADEEQDSQQIVLEASQEVAPAVFTAVATTVISFLPVFTMQASEGKLFRPLAFTKTFALIAAIFVALTLIPALAHLLLSKSFKSSGKLLKYSSHALILLTVALVFYALTKHWMPLSIELGFFRNLIFVSSLTLGLLLLLKGFHYIYGDLLDFFLEHKLTFFTLPLFCLLFGASVWIGLEDLLFFLPDSLRNTRAFQWAEEKFPGLGKEFMPDLDEGSYLLMPTTMPHASIGEAIDILALQDQAINALPEVELAVGKIGRVKSPLDPAPISMVETVINYYPEYISDRSGNPRRFKYDADAVEIFKDESGHPLPAPDGKSYKVRGKFLRKDGELIEDEEGRPFRLWRPPLDPSLNPGREEWKGIESPDDIWKEILRVSKVPGVTSAPKLQPIAARLVMLQSGMRAPMGVKVLGKGKSSLEELEAFALKVEDALKELPSVKAKSVTADRVVGKPYLEFEIDRQAIARYGLDIEDVQSIIRMAIGGKRVSSTIEGRERYGIVLRYQREFRDNAKRLLKVLVPTPGGAQIPLEELLEDQEISYRRGPRVIKSEDGSLVSYVLFDKVKGKAEVEVVEEASKHLNSLLKEGQLALPPGMSYEFAGSYEQQVRSEKRLQLILPLALFLIFIILYMQFKRVSTTLIVFSGIAVAWSGGFIMIWLYSQGWFLDLDFFGKNLRDLFQMQSINLSVAVWVGFLALFGIATDDGVLMASYLDQSFEKNEAQSKIAIRAATKEAALRRIRPCLMTTATTLLALLPVLSSTGKGSNIMLPMAIPCFGGMALELLTTFVVPVLYCTIRELGWNIDYSVSSSPSKETGQAQSNQ